MLIPKSLRPELFRSGARLIDMRHNARRGILHFSAVVGIKEKWGVFERGLGPVTARKLRAEGSEQRSGQ